MARIDRTVDDLYAHPAPAISNGAPATVRAGNLRWLLLQDIYGVRTWPDLSDTLVLAFNGTFDPVAQVTVKPVNSSLAGLPGGSQMALLAIVVRFSRYLYRRPPLIHRVSVRRFATLFRRSPSADRQRACPAHSEISARAILSVWR
jgi:hypothetical protein